MQSPRKIGRVISVKGSHLKVELLPEVRSYHRATEDGTELGVGVGTMLTLPLGGEFFAIGIIEELEAREQNHKTEEQSGLFIMPSPLGVASVQLLGKFRDAGTGEFHPTVTTLPTLDTFAEITTPRVRDTILADAPKRHKPQPLTDPEYDIPLSIGRASGARRSAVCASFNDLFARPLAIIGNTGSGKSYTVASIIQSAQESLTSTKDPVTSPHLFVLDINGEYTDVFSSGQGLSPKKLPHKIYVNGVDFPLPAWLMDSKEVCAWLLAAEATQTPALKEWWAAAKAGRDSTSGYNPAAVTLQRVVALAQWLDDNKPFEKFADILAEARSYDSGVDWRKLDGLIAGRKKSYTGDPKWMRFGVNERSVRDELHRIQADLLHRLAQNQDENERAVTADTPLYIPREKFFAANLVNPALGSADASKVGEYLVTLKFRLQERLADPRWMSFFSYECPKICDFLTWLSKLGVQNCDSSRIVVIDLSMLASDVLTMACAMFGRILLEMREKLDSRKRVTYPWVIVLEEAHNYAGPPKSTEDRMLALSRETFERIAKEGRKFGLSLVVASQRPNEISPTIMSQCANFVSHRLQNPDDIKHLRDLAPAQAQRLLDQVALLDSGEAIVFGSSFHVPSRVQVKQPEKAPQSATSTPYAEWRCKESASDLSEELRTQAEEFKK